MRVHSINLEDIPLDLLQELESACREGCVRIALADKDHPARNDADVLAWFKIVNSEIAAAFTRELKRRTQ